MKSRAPQYPDISDILARKARGRRELAALSFGEKLDMLDALRGRVEPLRRAREKRRHERRPSSGPAPTIAAARKRAQKGRKK